MNIKIPLFIIVLFVLSSLIYYKYFEWSVINSLNSFHNTFFSEHFYLQHKGFAIQDETHKYGKEFESKDEKEVNNDTIAEYWKKNISFERLSLNIITDIGSLLQDNQNKLLNFEKQSKFLFGPSGKSVKTYINFAKKYIELYKAQNDRSIATSYGLINFYQMSLDQLVISEFDEGYKGGNGNTTALVNYASKNLANLMPIQNYSNSEYKLEGEDCIKDQYPEFYAHLIKNRSYLSSYYEMMKDYAANDIDSATYKYGKYYQTAVDLNVDITKLDKQTYENRKVDTLAIIKTEMELVDLSDSLSKQIKNYPLLKSGFLWPTNLIKCDYMVMSSEYFLSLTEEYPEAQTYTDLVQELNTKGISIANYEYSPDLFKLTNNDEELTFTCVDNVMSRTYEYRHYKPEKETESEKNTKGSKSN